MLISGVYALINISSYWPGAKFRWDRESPYIPGWDVTQPWTTEDGLSKKGFFSVQYYCGNGKNKNGCKADVLQRKCLMQMTAVKETDVIDEDYELTVPRSERPTVGEELMLGKTKGSISTIHFFFHNDRTDHLLQPIYCYILFPQSVGYHIWPQMQTSYGSYKQKSGERKRRRIGKMESSSVSDRKRNDPQNALLKDFFSSSH